MTETGTRVETVPATARAIVPLLAYQRRDVESAARFTWSCWSRQIGKSFTKSLRRILRGLMRRRNQVFLSAGERQSRELMLKARQHCEALQIATEFLTGESGRGAAFRHLEIRLPNGVRVIGLPANPMTARGFTGDVFLDEFAMHREDREIWAAVFPTVLRGEGELDVASTPKGMGNVFSDLRGNREFEHSTVTLYEAIAQGLDLDAERIRRSMGDDALFRQEFLCEFLDEAGSFLTYEQIAPCEDAAVSKKPAWERLDDRETVAFVGVDVGRRRDLTVMWVLAREADGRLATLGVIEMRNEPFRRQYEMLKRLLASRGVRRCCVDASGVGGAMAEAAQEDFGESRVEALVFSCRVKDSLATRLKRAIEDRAVRLPADESIRNDLHSVRWDVTAGEAGRFVVSAGGDSHADRFWALALAIRAAEGAVGRPVEFASTGACRFARRGVW